MKNQHKPYSWTEVCKGERVVPPRPTSHGRGLYLIVGKMCTAMLEAQNTKISARLDSIPDSEYGMLGFRGKQPQHPKLALVRA